MLGEFKDRKLFLKLVEKIINSCYNKIMTPKDVVNLFKRFLIVFICMGIPLLCILTFVAKLKSVLVIVITVLLVGGFFGLEEYLHYKKTKRKLDKTKRENEK